MHAARIIIPQVAGSGTAFRRFTAVQLSGWPAEPDIADLRAI